MKCPQCGHEWPDESRAKGGHNKWAGMTQEQRSAEMSRVRKKGLKKHRKRKASAGESNRGDQPREAPMTAEERRDMERRYREETKDVSVGEYSSPNA